jgi:hypothetical protein
MTEEDKDASRRAYHRQYYHDNKQPEQCAHCAKIFSSHSALVRHTRNNVKCILQRTVSELREIKESMT